MSIKTYLLFLCISFLLFPVVLLSQGGTWVWVNGDSTVNVPSYYTGIGTYDPLNKPGGCYEPASWIDKTGCLWIYGCVSTHLPFSTYQDSVLWQYNPYINQWRLVGDWPPYHICGTQQEYDSTNSPGERGYAAATWVDTSGIFWVYSNSRPDLWNYDPATNMWTWFDGLCTAFSGPVYGTQGVPSPANTPGGRGECTANWVDEDNNLWLFGGLYSAAQFDEYNDLWRYNISTNEWTWMKGFNGINSPGHYGTLNVEDSLNMPPAHMAWSKSKDAAGNFYIFGGATQLLDSTYNDVWRYNKASNNFTWINGSNLENNPGIYPPPCMFTSNGYPHARFENKGCATDTCGNVWMFGGGINNPNGFTCYNDLWIYSMALNQYKLIWGGAVQSAGHYGIKGVPDPANEPPSRLGAVAWMDTLNRFFIFSGFSRPGSGLNNSRHNDVWMFIPDTACYSCGVATGANEHYSFNSSVSISPVPFTETVTITYLLKKPGTVQVELYNAMQQAIRHIVLPAQPSGRQQIELPAANFPAGVYFIKVQLEGSLSMHKIIKIK